MNEEAKTKIDFLNYKGKYRLIVEEIYSAVGEKENFSKFYNCVTRLRIKIKDRKLVDEGKIKKTNLVKGIHWNGDELQIIFGGEVYKIAEEFEKFIDEIKHGKHSVIKINPKSKKQKMIDFLKGVVMPVLPALMAGGLLMAIYSLLQVSGAIVKVDPKDNHPITDYDVLSGIFYILSQTALTLIGVMFCYTTTKTLKGNPVMGILIGLTLASPFLFIAKSWHLFTFLGYDINISQYGNAVLVQVIAGVWYVYLDKWIKTWMPTSVDLVFRHALAYMFTILPIFFGLGPILGILETFITYGLTWVGNAGFGIGAGIFIGLWQPLVLTGLHHTVMLPIKAEFPNGGSILLLATSLNCFTQFGACMGVAIRTKNSNVRQACLTASPSCLFGVTEPIMYGVNLPKLWPFVYGCIGGFFAGMTAGWIGAVPLSLSGSGILNILRFIDGGTGAIIKIVIINALSFGLPFLLTLLFYRERISEIKGNKLVDSYLFKMYSAISKTNFKTIQKDFKDLITDKANFVSENQETFKEYENTIQTLVKVQSKIRQQQSKIDAKKEKLAKQIVKLQKNSAKQVKTEALIQKFIQFDENQKMDLLRKEEQSINLKVEQLTNKIQKIKEDYFTKAQILIDNLLSDEHAKEQLNNLYFNSINSIDINYQFTEKKIGKINWKEYKNYDHKGYLKERIQSIMHS